MENIINGKDLLSIGYKSDKIMGQALETAWSATTLTKEELLVLLEKIKDYPEAFIDDPLWSSLATAMVEMAATPEQELIPLTEEKRDYAVYGEDYIEEGARKQMDIAVQLPVALAGALMPDAHQGYGLPIGGVLAANNAVIPYGVGVDIGCRMALSIFDIPEQHFLENQAMYKRELIAFTKFGAGQGFRGRDKASHQVLDNEAFNSTPFLKQLHDKAAEQLGTSGGGNHFVEWGIMELEKADEGLNLPKGRFLALLSHSGSRGLGATIAGYYTRLAKELCRLPKEAANLAYLDLNSEAGQEYWLAMNLAGDYASACHEIIHQRLTRAVGATVLAKVENHHNFAWKETWNGQEVIVHRKGATPAGKGVMGIIPGSMTAPGFLVRGKGNEMAINSASHGAGRQLSRTKAIQSVSKEALKSVLKDHDVTLIGGGLDEAPMAYKDIHKVMGAQHDLVDVVATFQPKMVRMASDGSRED